MKKKMWIVTIIPLIVTLVVLRFMPDSVPMHYDVMGEIDRWGSKYENLIFPIIIIAMTFFGKYLFRILKKKLIMIPRIRRALKPNQMQKQ